MSLLVSLHKISKSFGTRELFNELSFTVNEGQKVGLLGPNGSGKSTLLRIIASHVPVDSGDISFKKSLKIAFIQQEEAFEQALTASQCAISELEKWGMDKEQAEIQSSIYLSMLGFQNTDQKVAELSGGWKKKLNLAIGFAKEADLYLLDEPTNHLDWDGIQWLENYLRALQSSFLLVSHDRAFLSSQCSNFTEVNRIYKEGTFSLKTDYNDFLKKKADYIQSQKNLQNVLSNKARREVEWLRAGVKARTTKSQSRAKEAYELLDELSSVQERNRLTEKKVSFNIDSSGRKAKEYIKLIDLNIGYQSENVLLKNLNLTLGPKKHLGLLGNNGSGKTSLLNVISQRLKPLSGDIRILEGLKVTFFDQKKEDIPEEKTIMTYLGDDSDHVIFRGKSIHSASYASFFLFDSSRLNLPIKRLSGGEKARLLIAKLLLNQCDILILDEPTNDLDIETIEILEESLQSFDGLVLLVSHDREFLNNVCQSFLSFDGIGDWTIYSDINQWLNNKGTTDEKEASKVKAGKPKSKSLKLSYKENQFLETFEDKITKYETDIENLQIEIQKDDVASNHVKLQELSSKIEAKQNLLDELYSEWERIENKRQEIEEQKKGR